MFMPFFSKLFQTKSYKRLGIFAQDRQMVTQKWSQIQQLLKLGGPSRLQKAVLEADKLLFFVLDKMGYSGSLGERLKEAKERFVSDRNYSIYNDLWEAHKVRNRIIHEVKSEVLSYEASDAVNKFEKGLRKLGVL